MDLLELNDIYYRDKVRIEHDKFFTDPVRVEYSFTPTEEHVMSTGDGRISAVVNKPFVGIRSVMLNHSIKEFMSEIHDDTPVTDHQFGADMEICQNHLADRAFRLNEYESGLCVDMQCHPDISFTDMLPGMTIVMDRWKNNNYELTKDYGNEDQSGHRFGVIEPDARSLSLIYMHEDGSKSIGYGGMIYTGRGLKSLCDELKIYLFSNTFIVGRSSVMDRLPDFKVMKTSCVIIYEDSLKRIIETLGEEQ